MKYPNGGKCMTCVNLFAKCDHIPFEECRPCGKVDKQGDQQVLCPEFEKHGLKWHEREEYLEGK